MISFSIANDLLEIPLQYSLDIRINNPPTKGTILLSPVEGAPISTVFTIQINNATGNIK